MKFYKVLALIYGAAVVGLVLVMSPTSAFAVVDCSAGAAEFTNVTVPNSDPAVQVTINRKHVMCGEVSGGRAKGFHAEPGGTPPSSVAFTDETTLTPYEIYIDGRWTETGLYDLRRFNITDAGNGQTRNKPISTMFPDHCTEEDVLKAIANASYVQDELSGDTCKTNQGEEFSIQVWWLNGKINSAYPIAQ